MNTELFRKILAKVEAEPQAFDMSTWEAFPAPACGTTRCIAGWAVYLETGVPLYQMTSDGFDVSPESKALAVRLGFEDGEFVETSWLAARLLDLSPGLANMFYLGNGNGLTALRLAAQGDEAGIRALLEGVDLLGGEE